ncbi:hypothetical protein PAB09_02525 [Corynebacterium sp. SCR221107]|nr:DUF6541 family protein [Corynebacterium sp. SCR221107]WBT09231.1 hypothetical protein PAB09_02525 [Corynebacterium sp. SCR221107]
MESLPEITQVAVIAIAVFLIPGFVLNLISGTKLPWAIAAAVPTSFAIFGFTGWLTGQTGIRYGIPTVAAMWILLCIGAFFFHRLVRRRRSRTQLAPAPAARTGWWRAGGRRKARNAEAQSTSNGQATSPMQEPSTTTDAAASTLADVHGAAPTAVTSTDHGAPMVIAPSPSQPGTGGEQGFLSRHNVTWILPGLGAIVGCLLFLRASIKQFAGFEYTLGDIFQGWDVHWHASVVRWAMDSGIVDPTRMGELRNLDGHATMYYPSGWHAGAALVGDIAKITPIEATNLTGFVLPALALPLSVALLAWRIVGNRGLMAQLGAGLAGIGIYAFPTVFWIGNYVGAWPYVAAICMTGIVIALFMSVPTNPERALAAGLSFMAVVMVHPSAATVVVVFLGLWWLAKLVFQPSTPAAGFSGGLKVRARDFGLLALTGGIAGALLLPQLLAGSETTEEVAAYTDIQEVTRAESWGQVFTMATRHTDEFGQLNWAPMLVLAAIGAIVAAWKLNLWAHLTFAFSAWVTTNSIWPYPQPWDRWLEVIGALHYNSAHRLIMPIAMLLCAAAGVGAAALIRLISGSVLRSDIARRISAVVSIICGLVVGAVFVPLVEPAVREGADFAIGSPHDSRLVGDADRRAFDWLAKQPKSYEGTIMGEPADGHGWMYAYNSLPAIMKHYALPTYDDGSAEDLLVQYAHLVGAGNHGDARTRNKVDWAYDALEVNYLMASPPNFWAFQKENRALNSWLYTSPGLTLVYKDGPIAIFAVNAHFSDAQLEAMREAGSPDPLPEQLTYGELGIDLEATVDELAGTGAPGTADIELDRGDTSQAPESGTDDDGNEYLYGDATTKRDVNPYNVPYYHRPTVKDQGGIDITEVTPDPVSY